MGHEIGIEYELVGPDGTIAVFNTSGDPDFVGYLKEVGGLDSPEVREASEDIPGWDGAHHGSFFAGRRPVTLEGIIDPAVDYSPALRNAKIDKLLRATNALREDALLKWQESGGVARQISLRRQQPTRITQRVPKAFLAALVAEDPRIVSQAIHTQSVLAGAISSSGEGFPLDFPLDFNEISGTAGSISATNAGNGDAIPWFTVTGPITNPRLVNNTTGKELRLIYTLASGETLIVDGRDRSIKLNGVVDRYSALDFANSEWWTLQPGANDVRLLSTAYSAPAALAISWRDTWL